MAISDFFRLAPPRSAGGRGRPTEYEGEQQPINIFAPPRVSGGRGQPAVYAPQPMPNAGVMPQVPPQGNVPPQDFQRATPPAGRPQAPAQPFMGPEQMYSIRTEGSRPEQIARGEYMFNPQYGMEYEDRRRAAVGGAMQSGQPMVVTGGNLYVGDSASRAPGIGSAPISGEGGFDPSTARVARAYMQQINQMTAQGQTPTREQQVALQRNLVQQERNAQTSFEDRFARAQQAGLAAGGGAGNPQENAARYNQALKAMEEKFGPLDTAGRAEAREQRGAERAAMVAAAGARGRGGEQEQKPLKPLELTPEQKRTQSSYTRSLGDIASQQIASYQATLNESNPAYKSLTEEQKKAAQDTINIFKSQDYKDFMEDFTSLISSDDNQRRAFTDMISKADTPEKKAAEVLKLFNQWRTSNRPEGF